MTDRVCRQCEAYTLGEDMSKHTVGSSKCKTQYTKHTHTHRIEQSMGLCGQSAVTHSHSHIHTRVQLSLFPSLYYTRVIKLQQHTRHRSLSCVSGSTGLCLSCTGPMCKLIQHSCGVDLLRPRTHTDTLLLLQLETTGGVAFIACVLSGPPVIECDAMCDIPA